MTQYILEQIALTYAMWQSGFFMIDFKGINEYLEAKVYTL